jgi:hypothetical protein
MSSCTIPYKAIILTGGVMESNKSPVSTCFQVTPEAVDTLQKRKNMANRRWAHCSTYLNGYVYAIGGYSNKDDPSDQRCSMSSCERFSYLNNQWDQVQDLNESRAFSSVVSMKD